MMIIYSFLGTLLAGATVLGLLYAEDRHQSKIISDDVDWYGH